uniref:Uncharacterized protein n=1 Tax=Arundo donax TaxID=35708 RepID=A0A0A9FM69_ARUDO
MQPGTDYNALMAPNEGPRNCRASSVSTRCRNFEAAARDISEVSRTRKSKGANLFSFFYSRAGLHTNKHAEHTDLSISILQQFGILRAR